MPGTTPGTTEDKARKIGAGERRAGGDRATPVALVVLQTRPDGARTPLTTGALLRATPPGGPTALERMATGLRGSGQVKQVVLLLSPQEAEPALLAEAERLGLTCAVGERADRLTHLCELLRGSGAGPETVVVRVTTDCVLQCAEVVNAAVEVLLDGGRDYVATDLGSGVLPEGMDLEATFARRLFEAAETTLDPQARDQVTAALLKGPRGGPRSRPYELSPTDLGPALERSGRYYASFRLSFASEEDGDRLAEVTRLLDRSEEPRSLTTLLRLLDQHPEWRPGQTQGVWRRAG